MSIFELKPRVKKLDIAGQVVHIRVLSGRQLEEWESDREQSLAEGRFLATLVSMCLCTKDGDSLAADCADVNELSADILKEIWQACVQFNGLMEEEDAPKEIPSGSSGTNSDSHSDGPSGSSRRLSTPGSLKTG